MLDGKLDTLLAVHEWGSFTRATERGVNAALAGSATVCGAFHAFNPACTRTLAT